MVKMGMGEKEMIHPPDIFSYRLNPEISAAVNQDILAVSLNEQGSVCTVVLRIGG